MPTVSVTINEKNYRMACDDGQEAHLETLAQRFDTNVQQLKESFGDIGDQRLVVMAGIMTTDELVEAKRKVATLEAELAKIKTDAALENRERKDGDDELAKGIQDAAEKIEQLSLKLSSGG